MSHFYIELTIFLGAFLSLSVILSALTKRFTSIPYTIALLAAGLYAQHIFEIFKTPVHIYLDPSLIYHVLLPILLFESAFHINIHQLKIQFKTINFLATIGLLISVAVTGFTLFY
ncbi:MAG TPA: cation:proton antiporter, partial [Candidatus Woesebacteria bacterium]|nr:cation:proton antiporter [Candidatus Woesebacteria bacterium]